VSVLNLRCSWGEIEENAKKSEHIYLLTKPSHANSMFTH